MSLKFNEELLEISDGRLYGVNDMVKVGCHDCEGCSDCCQGMGDTILLDPFDVHRLSEGLHMSFEQLLQGPLELHLEEGLILPNLRMVRWNEKLMAKKRELRAAGGEGTVALMTPKAAGEACFFLNEQGRCSIHSLRPGICRAFPLGRSYEGEELLYFLLKDECPAKNKTKVKVSKWLDAPQLRSYQEFLVRWHALTKQMRAEVTADPSDEEGNRRTSMMFLQYFYGKPYESGDFFAEFAQRMKALG